MPETSESRVAASLAHHSDVAKAMPFTTDHPGVTAVLGGLANIGSLERQLPDGWGLANITTEIVGDRAVVQVMPA